MFKTCWWNWDLRYTNTFIEIPLLPLTIDKGIFKKYQEEFLKLETDFLNKKDYHHFATEAESCLEIDSDGNVLVNSLGLILWEKYKSEFFFFYQFHELLILKHMLLVFEDVQKNSEFLINVLRNTPVRTCLLLNQVGLSNFLIHRKFL